MKNEILAHINNPIKLEQLYRQDKQAFKSAFNMLYADHKEKTSVQFWDLRLNYNEPALIFGNKKEFWMVFTLALIAGCIANISNLPNIKADLFFTRNISFIIIPFVSAYFLWKQNVDFKKKVIFFSVFLIAAIYINLLPQLPTSASINLTFIHLPLFLWCLLGLAYLGNESQDLQKRIHFLKYNGDLIIICVVLFLSGVLFTLITFGLFELIGLKIEQFYVEYIAIWAIGGIPLFGTYLISNNPQITNKITPIIAKLFTPLVLINLSIYLVALVYKGKYPHHDRSVLLVYNALLVGVLALIFFSIAEAEKTSNKMYNALLLLSLSILTIIVNAIALYAISFRIFEYGITANRIAVLGGNVLIFVNLLIVASKLIGVVKNKSALISVEEGVAKYLPVYAVWTGLVAFLFPLLFGLK